MLEEKVEVRDMRHQGWLWTSKDLLFHKNVDEKMYKVYSGLAAYANNNTQKAFPSIGTLMERLHMGRNTIIRALQKLEAGKFISTAREQGENNVYSLLEIESIKEIVEQEKAEFIKTVKPAASVRDFFKGVRDLRDKILTQEADDVRGLLIALTSKYPEAPKEIMWQEVKQFERYWTERNATGTKERWEKQPTFEIDRRLATWFSKKDQFKVRSTIGAGKGNKVIA